MAAEFESQVDPGQVADWELELQKVGFARRMLLARKWYRTDWWFVAISSVMVVAFLIVAAVPQWLARHDPDAKERSLKCGGCGRKDKCDGASDRSI